MITREQIEQLGSLICNISPDKHYWFFRTMGGTYYDEFVSRGYIAFGYDGITMKDLKNIPERDDMARAYLKIRLQELDKYLTDSQTAKAAGQIVKFYRGLAVGDVVVAPSYQSKKFAIGVIESEMYEDSSKHAEGECQFVKRRKVRWEKEVWRSELDPKAILAFGNQQTMSSIDEYAEYIDRKISNIYNKGEKTYLVLRVNQDKGLSWDDFTLIGDLGTLFKEFSDENNLGIDLSQIEMKINVQSPGDILMIIPDGTGYALIIVLAIITLLGGTFKHKSLNSETEISTGGFGKFLSDTLSAISDFLDRKQEREIIKAKEKLQNMQIEQQNLPVIESSEDETIALPSSPQESSDDTPHS